MFKKTNIADLIRDQLKLVRKPVDIDNMEKKDRDEFLRGCYDVFHNPVFELLLDIMTQTQKDSTFEGAENLEHFLCGRMSVYGIEQVRKEFQGYATEYEALKEKPVYDKNAII